MASNPLYVSNRGGTINSFRSDSGWLYRVCFDQFCLYCDDLLSAKLQLLLLEKRQPLSTYKTIPTVPKYADGLRALVESAAAPYLEKEVA